ncbi:sensor histidine kinase, partial [Shigella flexneri]|uniref:sensor histidine kinase n=1 Tax=Shigella flexneri TaxID=623 RepID=UPI0020966367
DLRGHVRTVARELEPLVASRRQELRIDLPQCPLVAKVDPQRFQQVVRNVLANAIKFSPDGSCVQLRAAADCQDMIHIEVEDQGPGIPEAELERIFEAFAQSSATRNGFGGTGLGLAICRKIVEALQGRPLVVRTLDIGGDKRVPHLDLPVEENPFLGVRGALLALRRDDLLVPQLRALYRAARH